jgi:hypothetical protein
MIMLGTAGTGKSFTVAAISKLKANAIIRACPTAKAAFLIHGETLHSTFDIPVTANENENFLPLEGKRKGDLEATFKDINFIIIDEFSMLSQVMLAKIDLRCKQAKNNTNSFGGISIMLIGDPGQLLPVCSSSLYDTKLKTTLTTGGFLAYKKFDMVIKLEALMRQNNQLNDPRQALFIDLLPRLRNGTSTIEDYELLKTRAPSTDTEKEFEKAMYIFNDNESVDRRNFEHLEQIKMPTCELVATNSSPKGRASSAQHFGGLENSIFISLESQIVLTNNLWKKKGNKIMLFT